MRSRVLASPPATWSLLTESWWLSHAGCTALSFGVHCARLAGLDPGVLQRAKQVLARPKILVANVHMSAASAPFASIITYRMSCACRHPCEHAQTPACCSLVRPAISRSKMSGRHAASRASLLLLALLCIRDEKSSVRTHAMRLPATTRSGMPRRCWRCSRPGGLCRR